MAKGSDLVRVPIPPALRAGKWEIMTRREAKARDLEFEEIPPPKQEHFDAETGKRITEQEAIARGVHHREKDWARVMHNQHHARKLERDECTFIMPEDNKQTGEPEVVYMKKAMPNSEKRQLVAAAFRRAGRDVNPSDITFYNE